MSDSKNTLIVEYEFDSSELVDVAFSYAIRTKKAFFGEQGNSFESRILSVKSAGSYCNFLPYPITSKVSNGSDQRIATVCFDGSSGSISIEELANKLLPKLQSLGLLRSMVISTPWKGSAE